jgi:hypothetical protein
MKPGTLLSREKSAVVTNNSRLISGTARSVKIFMFLDYPQAIVAEKISRTNLPVGPSQIAWRVFSSK